MEQIDLLANFIMAEIEGEPSQDEGAGDCAIRIIKQLKEENEKLKEENDAFFEILKPLAKKIMAEMGEFDALKDIG